MHIVVAIAVVAVLALGFMLFRSTPEEVAETAEAPQEQPVAAEAAPQDVMVADDAVMTGGTDDSYVDGTYSSTGSYQSPAGPESVTVTLALEGGVVTEATFEGHATHPGSVTNQGKFSEGYQGLVVGKSIDEIDLSVVNGSSLTPMGFMDAVAQIKEEARS